MAILAADHFAERIVGAVVGAYLPLRTKIFETVVRYVFSAGVDVVLSML